MVNSKYQWYSFDGYIRRLVMVYLEGQFHVFVPYSTKEILLLAFFFNFYGIRLKSFYCG